MGGDQKTIWKHFVQISPSCSLVCPFPLFKIYIVKPLAHKRNIKPNFKILKWDIIYGVCALSFFSYFEIVPQSFPDWKYHIFTGQPYNRTIKDFFKLLNPSHILISSSGFLHQIMMTELLIHHSSMELQKPTNSLDIKMKDPKKWPEENPQTKRFLMCANNIVAGRLTNEKSLNGLFWLLCIHVLVTIIRIKY